LAEKYASDPNIVIAKIDANANDFSVPNFEVTGYPTLALFPAGDKTPILFEEDEMTTRAMWNFVRVNRKSMPSKKPMATPEAAPAAPAAPADQVKDEL
jgi:protein disulfide-isomerase A1